MTDISETNQSPATQQTNSSKPDSEPEILEGMDSRLKKLIPNEMDPRMYLSIFAVAIPFAFAVLISAIFGDLTSASAEVGGVLFCGGSLAGGAFLLSLGRERLQRKGLHDNRTIFVSLVGSFELALSIQFIFGMIH